MEAKSIHMHLWILIQMHAYRAEVAQHYFTITKIG